MTNTLVVWNISCCRYRYKAVNLVTFLFIFIAYQYHENLTAVFILLQVLSLVCLLIASMLSILAEGKHSLGWYKFLPTSITKKFTLNFDVVKHLKLLHRIYCSTPIHAKTIMKQMNELFSTCSPIQSFENNNDW